MDNASSPQPAAASSARRRSRRGIAIAVVALLLVTAGFGLDYQARQLEVDVSDTTLSVRSGIYSASIPISEIREVIVADSLPRIARRGTGFTFRSSRRGTFHLDSIGDVMVFVTLDAPPYIMIRSRSTTVILSFRDPARAKELVTDLSRRAGGG